jgi:integrase
VRISDRLLQNCVELKGAASRGVRCGRLGAPEKSCSGPCSPEGPRHGAVSSAVSRHRGPGQAVSEESSTDKCDPDRERRPLLIQNGKLAEEKSPLKSVTLPVHKVIESSNERGLMARKRYQKGQVFLSGKNEDKWIGRYREDVIGMDGRTRRVRRDSILGTKRELPTKRLAQRRLDAILARINGLDYRATRVATFEEFLERWKTEVLPSQKLSSVRAVRSHLKCYIIPELGTVRLEQFGVENQQTFIARMPERSSRKTVSRKTVLNVLGTLSTILTTARDWGYNCQQIEMSKLRLPPQGAHHEAAHFTVDQLQRILMVADDPWRTMFYISAMDGLRAGEVLGLQWGDIDFERRLLHIRRSAWYGKVQTAKSEASETVLPIPDVLVDVLRNYKARWKPNPEGFLFVTRNGRPPSSNKVVEYHLWTILDALGIPRCGLHAFRHSHTALLLDCGATPKVVQRQLRHSDARTTLEIYGHVVGDGHREAVERVASMLEVSGGKPTRIN